MEYFEVKEQKTKEKIEEEKYQELYQKQAKVSRIILLACFGGIGLVFLILGLSFLPVEALEDSEISITFIVIGAIFLVLGVLSYFIIPSKGNYERYKRNLNRLGGLNYFSISVSVKTLEEQFEQLKQENENLKRKIEDLERRNR
ncbi:MAG: hypothetical protein K2N64_00885 [Anaeroplasmataceae bacterium]|nr:hypothetical protein [Anaeroplasmataceae bacterium]